MAFLSGCASTSSDSSIPAAGATASVNVVLSSPGAPCATFTGKPSGETLDKGTPNCITGADVASDATTYGSLNCTLPSGVPATAHFWVSSDAYAPDQNEYAALGDGDVVVVTGGHAGSPAESFAVQSAVGC
jgi:hypothetical protein